MKSKYFLNLLRKRIIILFLLIAQFALIIYTLVSRSAASEIINSVLSILSLGVCIYIISQKGKTAFKLLWIFNIMLFPLFGGIFYLIFRLQTVPKKYVRHNLEVYEKVLNELKKLERKGETAKIALPDATPRISYLENCLHLPIFADEISQYFPSGEDFYFALKNELEKAEKFIFLEFFIIHEGVMWDSILDILKKKASEGVKVRVMYDDMGCFLLLPKDYPEKLKAFGIECSAFNPFRPVISTLQNNRDHRKIAVIDGKTAFTGGVNLSDEYINVYEKHGHWKDCAIMLKGDAVNAFTLMFLQLWHTNNNTDEDFETYLTPYSPSDKENGFVQPYCDSPLDTENVGEHVYLQIINNAKKYVYINTPYFIVDEMMLSALCLAAKSGVDVRLVTPSIADKKAVHMTTRSYYRELTEAGVKVYEYTKGFIHSKTFVSDDVTATVGTVNLDYRSLYHHFECGVCLYGTDSVLSIKEDFLKTLQVCRRITLSDCNYSLPKRLIQSILRLISPLL